MTLSTMSKKQTNSVKSDSSWNKAPKNAKKHLAMKTGIKWYKLKLASLPKKHSSGETLTRDQINELRSEALTLIKSDIYLYEELKANSPKRDDFEWIRTVLSNGTVSDKLAAHTVLIQDSTVHNLKSVDNLIRFVNTKGKRECVMAIDNLRELFIGDLLIPEEKLHTFEDLMNSVDFKFLQKSNDTNRNQFLIISHVEDQIRSYYKRFLDQLVSVSHDTLEALKMKSIRTMFDLFVHNPEQEKHLLSSMINKLGDPTPKIASQSARLLSQVISQHHPQMKMVIVKEVERLLFRPHITERAQYYCLCFLSEIIFTQTVDQELANYLINIYFTIFNKCTKLGEVNNKTMSVLLTGVSRAFPYSKLENSFLEKYLNTFYRILHYVNMNTGIQTLSLIFNLVNFNESGSLTDRYYTALYRFIFDPQIDQCSKSNLLLNVIYRSIKKDPIHKRVRAFVKRIFQVALQSSSAFVISVLILFSETLKFKTGFKIETNVLLKQQAQNKSTEVDKECESISQNPSQIHDDEDDTEIYYDVDEDGESDSKTVENIQDRNKSNSSWVYVKKQPVSTETNDSQDKSVNVSAKSSDYSTETRNPLFCNAEFEECWELSLLQKHFHPTAKLFTEKVLQYSSLNYDGDPLEDFTIKHFLDRFVFRNPKQSVINTKSPSIDNRRNVFGRMNRLSSKNLNKSGYTELPETSIPVDEQFIYRYLKQKQTLKGANNNDDDDSDLESVTSFEFNDMLDNYESYNNDEDDIEDIDFAQNLKETSKKVSKKSKKANKTQPDDEADDEVGDDVDFDEEFEDDDFISDDEDGFEDEDSLDEANEEHHDSDAFEQMDLGGDDDCLPGGKKVKKARNAAPFAGKKGFSSITNDIFASAEEFSHLLEQNESDSDYELNENSTQQINETSNDGANNFGTAKKRKKGKNFKPKRKPSLGRIQNKKKHFQKKKQKYSNTN